MHSHFWCCKSCGFAYNGGQPAMECPICEAYKASFVSCPAQIEATLIKEFKEGLTNTVDARQRRLALLKEGGFLKNPRLRGRTTEAVHNAGDSRKPL